MYSHEALNEKAKAAEEREIAGFAKHYAIPTSDARKCWLAGGRNWARAFDELVKMYKAEGDQQ